MLKTSKLAALSIARSLGISRLILNSEWRRQRLLILCYHGVSIQDEHQWDPALYMTQSLIRSRFQFLKDSRCTVLRLSEAVRALYAGELPSRAVVITFDDGFYDFYHRALPALTDFGFPATVYLTTYYSNFNRPVFDPALNYILWKGLGRELHLPDIFSQSIALAGSNYQSVNKALYEHVTRHRFSGTEKDVFLQRLATALKVDYDAICKDRILHLMTAKEASMATNAGVDMQLHTHRHRVSADREHFDREISDNRRALSRITSDPADHFCYPSGCFLPPFPEWLREAGVLSATTCIPGLVDPSSSRYLLPRLIDTSTLSVTEFASWVSGVAALLPKRKYVMDEQSLIEDKAMKAAV